MGAACTGCSRVRYSMDYLGGCALQFLNAQPSVACQIFGILAF